MNEELLIPPEPSPIESIIDIQSNPSVVSDIFIPIGISRKNSTISVLTYLKANDADQLRYLTAESLRSYPSFTEKLVKSENDPEYFFDSIEVKFSKTIKVGSLHWRVAYAVFERDTYEPFYRQNMVGYSVIDSLASFFHTNNMPLEFKIALENVVLTELDLLST